MPAKVKLTGFVQKMQMIRSPLNNQVFWHLLEVHESGSPVPKTLPPASKIHYTVIVADRQMKRLQEQLSEIGVKIKETKLIIEGEMTLDQPLTIVSGEIGLVTYKIDSLDYLKYVQSKMKESENEQSESVITE